MDKIDLLIEKLDILVEQIWFEHMLDYLRRIRYYLNTGGEIKVRYYCNSQAAHRCTWSFHSVSDMINRLSRAENQSMDCYFENCAKGRASLRGDWLRLSNYLVRQSTDMGLDER